MSELISCGRRVSELIFTYRLLFIVDSLQSSLTVVDFLQVIVDFSISVCAQLNLAIDVRLIYSQSSGCGAFCVWLISRSRRSFAVSQSLGSTGGIVLVCVCLSTTPFGTVRTVSAFIAIHKRSLRIRT